MISSTWEDVIICLFTATVDHLSNDVSETCWATRNDNALFFSGLLKKPFIPALKHSCLVDSWQSALRATTTMKQVRVICGAS